MELNREQIIKALECCETGRAVSCEKCPMLNIETSDDVVCSEMLARYALSLIKELTEENEAWQQRLISQEEKADKAYHDLACEVEDLRAENERLRDTAYRLECEVHRERANTVRKMQERLFEEFLLIARCQLNNEPNITSQDAYAAIRRVAKEMLEGTK